MGSLYIKGNIKGSIIRKEFTLNTKLYYIKILKIKTIKKHSRFKNPEKERKNIRTKT